MVVKSKVISEHMKDLDNVFETLIRHKLRLNTSKCSFGVRLGKFLGYMVTHRGIETEECASAFQQLKDYLARPPIMSNPELDEVLFAYIVVVPHATVLRSADYTRRIAKWGTILGAFDIKYMPRTSIKGKILADLVAEFTEPSLEEITTERDMDGKSVGMISQQDPACWEVYVDDAANRKGSGVGLVLISPERIIIEKSLRLDFGATNYEAEYEALLMRMSMVRRMGGEAVELFSDSRLVVGQWGLDIVSPFPKTAGNRKYLLVGTDYFTKWVEAEPLANIRDVDVQRFVWKNIITRFGVPHTLISDNSLQFDSNAFPSYCSELEITNRYSTPAYPQGNGQAEAVNKVIVNGLKKILDDVKGKWVEELPHVLWAYRTTPRRSTRETSFSMTYGAEAIIPLEMGFPTLKTSSFSPTSNDKLLEAGLDLIEERRENAMVRLAHYQQKLRQGYDANVKLRPLEPGDLVLRKVVGTAKNPTWGN
ncbi:uncharacterized protein LOC136066359 [Quercus suber]|uniref:uncharacterized protein LOC136066359 n=1 Tax=Quercus suber TaxID=58331 RepID=UPI0032DF01D9